MPNNNPRIGVLDLSRLLAAIFVVLFHISSGTNSILNLGYISVDYFFVLSGFVLARNILGIRTMSEASVFVKKRFIRLFPNAALSLAAVSAITGAVWFFGSRDSAIWQNFSATSIFAYLTLMSVFVSQSITLNYPIWSLSSEFVANMTFAILRFGSRSLPAKLIVLSISPILFYIVSLNSAVLASEQAWIEPLIRTCSGLAIGCLLHEFLSEISNYSIKLGILAVGLVLIFTSGIEIGFQLISCVIIKVLVEYSHRLESYFRQSLLIVSGELSFLIYLLHVPILSCVDLLLLKSNVTISSVLYIQAPIRLLIVLCSTLGFMKVRRTLQIMVFKR